MSYWLIAVPNEGKKREVALKQLDAATMARGLSANHALRIPSDLKVGTLDSLMALSDELSKFDALVGGTTKKIEKTYFEIYRSEAKDGAPSKDQNQNKTNEPSELLIGQDTPKDYVEKFAWNKNRYNTSLPLRQLIDTIVKDATKAEETLKKQVTDYNDVRTSYNVIERRDTGSLLVKPLGPYVKKTDIIEGDYLTTLLLVIPRQKAEEFELTYEKVEEEFEIRQAEEKKKKEEEAKIRAEQEQKRKDEQAKASGITVAELEKRLADKEEEKRQRKQQEKEHHDAQTHDHHEEKKKEETIITKIDEHEEKKKAKAGSCRNVVPGSARKLCDENFDEYVLYRVVVLKKGLETIKQICRDKRWTVRPFKYDPDEDKKQKEYKEQLLAKRKQQWNFLIRWCQTTYSEIFAAWIHLKVVRLFVEAVLRYGLPVDFSAAIIEPFVGKDKQLRGVLQELYAKLASENVTAALDSSEQDLSGFGQDFYPYVYLPLSIRD